MESRRSRHSLAVAVMVAMTGLAACAHPAPPPPPAVEAPPPAPPMPPPEPAAPPPAAEMPAPPPPEASYHFDTRHRTYLRVRPAGKVIAVLPPGTPVERMGPWHGAWGHVHTPRGNGWVLHRDLRPT